ncbi:MAG TPA: hypothetical protein VN428_07005 [Bryobacteraceae bacterium]|nr:hypothetical protein [Bryobacteraceae bacterium]
MTIFEMLDVLESEIAELRAERARLRSALGNAEGRLRTISEALPPTVERRNRSKRSRKEDHPRTEADSPAAPPCPETNTATVERSIPSLGKRVALGRGLAQLRRTSTPDG